MTTNKYTPVRALAAASFYDMPPFYDERIIEYELLPLWEENPDWVKFQDMTHWIMHPDAFKVLNAGKPQQIGNEMNEVIPTQYNDAPCCEGSSTSPIKEKLQRKKASLEADLATINAGLAALEASPDAAKILEAVSGALHV